MTPNEAAASCPNCGAVTTVGDKQRYCAACGQNNSLPRLETKAVLLEAMHSFVGWDTALTRTLSGLARAPGTMVAEYVAGKRRNFVNPARFCLLSMAMWFFAMHSIGPGLVELAGVASEVSASEQGMENEAAMFLIGNLELLAYLSLPFLAIALYLLFRQTRRNLAESLVLVLYLFGFKFLATVLFVPFETARFVAGLIFGPLWFTWAVYGFFGLGLVSTLWRVLIAYLLYLLATLLFFGGLAIPWALLQR